LLQQPVIALLCQYCQAIHVSLAWQCVLSCYNSFGLWECSAALARPFHLVPLGSLIGQAASQPQAAIAHVLSVTSGPGLAMSRQGVAAGLEVPVNSVLSCVCSNLWIGFLAAGASTHLELLEQRRVRSQSQPWSGGGECEGDWRHLRTCRIIRSCEVAGSVGRVDVCVVFIMVAGRGQRWGS